MSTEEPNIPSIADGLGLEDKHVVVTGVAGAIGETIAEDFAKAGAYVTGVDIAEPDDADWRASGQFHQADISKPTEASEAIDSSIEEAGEIDILVNNAGINRLGTVEEVSVEDWDAVLEVNLRGTFMMSKFALPSIRQTNGVVVNIASGAGFHAGPRYAAYGPSKAGVINLTKQMALDYAEQDVRVNAIAPGVIKAGMAKQELCDEETAERKRAITPMNRLGRPRDVANSVLFVASDVASFITGSTIVTDGGSGA